MIKLLLGLMLFFVIGASVVHAVRHISAQDTEVQKQYAKNLGLILLASSVAATLLIFVVMLF